VIPRRDSGGWTRCRINGGCGSLWRFCDRLQSISTGNGTAYRLDTLLAIVYNIWLFSLVKYAFLLDFSRQAVT